MELQSYFGRETGNGSPRNASAREILPVTNAIPLHHRAKVPYSTVDQWSGTCKPALHDRSFLSQHSQRCPNVVAILPGYCDVVGHVSAFAIRFGCQIPLQPDLCGLIWGNYSPDLFGNSAVLQLHLLKKPPSLLL